MISQQNSEIDGLYRRFCRNINLTAVVDEKTLNNLLDLTGNVFYVEGCVRKFKIQPLTSDRYLISTEPA